MLLNNGALYTIGTFTENGNIVLKENGWEIDREFGHLSHGYCVTSHASQGKSVQHVLIGQASWSFAASSREQFYVSVSRGDSSEFIHAAIRKGRLKLPSVPSTDPSRSRQREDIAHG